MGKWYPGSAFQTLSIIDVAYNPSSRWPEQQPCMQLSLFLSMGKWIVCNLLCNATFGCCLTLTLTNHLMFLAIPSLPHFLWRLFTNRAWCFAPRYGMMGNAGELLKRYFGCNVYGAPSWYGDSKQNLYLRKCAHNLQLFQYLQSYEDNNTLLCIWLEISGVRLGALKYEEVCGNCSDGDPPSQKEKPRCRRLTIGIIGSKS